MDDHQDGRGPAVGDPAGQAEHSEHSGQPEREQSGQGDRAEPDATDNPLARIDPDSDVVADAAAAKGGVNEPADDPLWNPALEPHDPQVPKGTKKRQEGQKQQEGQEPQDS